MSQLLISLNGIDERVLKKNINGVLISETDKVKVVEKYTLLQANFNSIDDLIKAKHIINDQIKIIKEIVIINRGIDLNMISYQYDYEYIKKCYLTITNIIYFLNVLIGNFNKKIDRKFDRIQREVDDLKNSVIHDYVLKEDFLREMQGVHTKLDRILDHLLNHTN